MATTSCYYKNNRNFWIFGAFFFLYFFIMATCFPFLPIWLHEVIGLNKTDTGIVFSSLSLFAILFQRHGQKEAWPDSGLIKRHGPLEGSAGIGGNHTAGNHRPRLAEPGETLRRVAAMTHRLARRSARLG